MAFPARWTHIDKVLNRSSPLAGDFAPMPEIKEFIQTQCRILLIGAGGLGCETLKDLALMGFLNIDVIDMDTIDLSNLNRQFLFREKDLKEYKATVAAKFINDRIPGANVVAHTCAIQDKDADFYKQFSIIVCGLDNLEARRWINAMVLSLCKMTDEGPVGLIPLVDGGTEAFKGQTMTILPRMTACFECRMELFPPPIAFPACTLKTNPRIPEHCIIYVKEKIWGEERPGEVLDKDDPAHVNWIVEKSIARAKEFHIRTDGITFQFTQGVIKNTIPAIASTNAIVSAQCALEVFKIATSCAAMLKDHSLFAGAEQASVQVWENERKPNCPVCNVPEIDLEWDPSRSLADLLLHFEEEAPFKLSDPNCRGKAPGEEKTKTLWMGQKSTMAEQLKDRLPKPMGELVPTGTVLTVGGTNLPGASWQVTLVYKAS